MTMAARVMLLLVAALATAMPARAQELTSVDSLVMQGRFTEARATLARWHERHPRSDRTTPATERAHALMLDGRLALDADAAHDAYLALVLGYPTASHTPFALLRLGQGMLATGEPQRARGYLERLALDYPNAEVRAEGLLWLARAQRATGRSAAACATVSDALRLRPLADETASLLRAEDALCTSATTSASGARGPIVAASTTTAAAARDARYAVQAGAFRSVASARELVRSLAAGGFADARIVVVPANALVRVRLGHFASSREATTFARRLFDAGFDAAVVDDAHRERTP